MEEEDVDKIKVKFEDRIYTVSAHHEWLAIDRDGSVFSYDIIPYTVDSQANWDNNSEQEYLASICKIIPDWEETLTKITEDMIIKDTPKEDTSSDQPSKEKTYRGILTKDYILDKAIEIKGEDVYKAEKLFKLFNISTPEVSVSGDTMLLTYKDNGSGRLISLAGFCFKTLHRLSEVEILSVEISIPSCKVLVRIPNE